MEIWKDIPNYEGKYKISNMGNVISCYDGNIYQLKPMKTIHGYLQVALYNHGIKTVWKVHRLVAITFIDNPNNYPCVNHKDENRLNNCVDNLEWCSYKYNNEYHDRHKKYAYKTAYKLGHTIQQYDLNHNLIATYYSIIEVCRQLNIPRTTLTRYIHKGKPYNGYIFIEG